jgi:maltooligosyltrehalose trehalohydrolase
MKASRESEHSRKSSRRLNLGANILKDGRIEFRVWAPNASQVQVKWWSPSGPRLFPMTRDERGYFQAELSEARPGDRYQYVLDGSRERPDPCSRWQPDGVHGHSCIVDPFAFRWSDTKWKGMRLSEMIFYEAHVGTFTPEGTFDSAIEKLPYLKKLGVTCLELMPVAQFPGKRNWGYDGVGLFAVQNSYGGPAGLKTLVDACHRTGLAVCLDVIYNHLGPEGNYLNDFGPYFSPRHHTPWGDAINFDGAHSDAVREWVIANALHWITEYHIDALRLDAIHGIVDCSARHLLEELGDAVHEQSRSLGREVLVIAESDLNDSRLLHSPKAGGYGLDAQWSDDFHHAAHSLLTGERSGYYEDFGSISDLARAIEHGFVYDGRYSQHRKRRHGNSTRGITQDRFVVCVQNHDQVGNRAFGERLGALSSGDAEKLAAALLLLVPNSPLLFMGQEYGEKAPFQYFIDHGDAGLVEAVRQGRKNEFAAFGWKEIPDPQSEKTFADSRLNWSSIGAPSHGRLLALYTDSIALRKKYLNGAKVARTKFDEEARWLAVSLAGSHRRRFGLFFSFADQTQSVPLPFSAHRLEPLLDTSDRKYGGSKQTTGIRHRGKIELAPLSCIFGVLS